MSKTLFAKLWDAHCIREDETSAFLYIDRVFLHERMGSVALQGMLAKGREVRCPGQVFCTIDHIADTHPERRGKSRAPGGEAFMDTLLECAEQTGIRVYPLDDPRQGIVHLVAAEQGIAHPGLSLVCPDSHTSTLGARGMLAWGLGASDAEHALTTRTLRVARPKTMRVSLSGRPMPGVGAKDMVLHMIGRLGADGGSGYALEYAGEAVRAMGMAERFTLCNMAVENAAFCGLVSVDETTLEYLKGRPLVPSGMDFTQWRSDPDAAFDREERISVEALEPVVTWGTSPEQALGIGDSIPPPDECRNPQQARRSLQYMGLEHGATLGGQRLDYAFIGSCTNARLHDLREAAALLSGRRISPGIRAVCVPGSTQTRLQAEREGLHRVFLDAGFEWHHAGCSMCFHAGGEAPPAGSRVISTSNRNFEGRQGPGVRTHLASPVTVAASALAGKIADPREWLQ